MSPSSSVAYSELTRVLPWSIRARGYAFGTADRASFVVANAASMAPAILSDIAALGARPAEAPLRRVHDGILAVEARGVSWLEIGPALMDHCGANAGRNGRVACHVREATEAGLLPAVLLVGADYGLSAAAVTCERGTSRWTLLGWSEEAAPRAMLLSGEGREALDRRLPGALRPEDLPDAVEGTRILSWRDPQLTITARDADAVDAQACIEAAFSRGIPVGPEVLAALYDLEKITWAPTSERSRAQAGFQVRPAGPAT